jgi:hypothetical protein
MLLKNRRTKVPVAGPLIVALARRPPSARSAIVPVTLGLRWTGR